MAVEFDTGPERADFCEGIHRDTELECKRLLALYAKSSMPNKMTVVAWLHSLAQALEGQGKFAEGLDARVRARDMLITLMHS